MEYATMRSMFIIALALVLLLSLAIVLTVEAAPQFIIRWGLSGSTQRQLHGSKIAIQDSTSNDHVANTDIRRILQFDYSLAVTRTTTWNRIKNLYN